MCEGVCVCGVWLGILFEEPNPTGSRPSDLNGLCKQHMKPNAPQTHKEGQGEGTEAIKATRKRQGRRTLRMPSQTNCR